MSIVSQNQNKSVGRKRKRSLAQQLGRFLSKAGLVKPANRVSLRQKRQKKATGTGFLLQFLFSFVFLVSSAYAMKVNPVPKVILSKFGVQKFLPKSSFYREICNLNLQSLQAFTDGLMKKTVKAGEKIIVTLDSHALKVWSQNYASATWGHNSDGSFFGYKVFAAILHGADIVLEHFVAPANFVDLNFAEEQVNSLLQKLPRIDVLLMDRGYFSFTFFAFLIEKGIGFVTVAKDDTAAIQPYLRDIARCTFHELKTGCWYHETILWFEPLRQNLRVIFVRKEVNGELHEYELISNLPAEYSAAQIIELYSKRQGREDVFDRLENELRLHKPCKIKSFEGVQAFVALTIAAYNVYTIFSISTVGTYFTLQVMYRHFLFNEIDKMIANKKDDATAKEEISEAERYKQDSRQTLFDKGNNPAYCFTSPFFNQYQNCELPKNPKSG